MERFIPLELLSYFWLFENHFSKPNFIYFQGYLWGLLLARGRKTTNNIAHCCFWVERSMSALGTLSGGKSLGCQSSHENSSDLATGKTRNATSSSWRISGGSRYFISGEKWAKNARNFLGGKITVAMQIEEPNSKDIIGVF